MIGRQDYPAVSHSLANTLNYITPLLHVRMYASTRG